MCNLYIYKKKVNQNQIKNQKKESVSQTQRTSLQHTYTLCYLIERDEKITRVWNLVNF